MNRLDLLVSMGLATALVACGNNNNDDTPSEDTDVVADTSDAGDITDDADATETDTTETDTSEDDVDTSVEPDIEEDTGPEPCPPPPEGPEPTYGRWSLSTFHFNVQYVAGGMEGFSEIAFNGLLPDDLNLDEETVEDRIISESLVPLLDVLERNPELALTFEMQGYMIDVMMERFPEDVARMRALVEAGQLELASIHWSDQFFLSFGREEMDESWARTQASFEAAELPLSRAIFTQEGQFGEGFASWLAEVRPDAIMVMATNIARFFQQDLVDAPLWDVMGTDIVLPRGLNNELVDRHISFFDDGELLATADSNPYFGMQFAADARAIAAYERELQCLVENGYQVATVTEYTDTILEAGFEPEPFPAFLDSTWQPQSTRGPLRWMGGAGVTWPEHEQDAAVIQSCTRARAQVLALDVVAELGASADVTDALDEAWRELLWGEVSDARGVNPWWGEIRYGIGHCDAAYDVATAALQSERAARGVSILGVDLASRTVLEDILPEAPTTWSELTDEPPAAVSISPASAREGELTWAMADDIEGLYRVDIGFPEVDGAADRYAACAEEREAWICDTDPSMIAVQFARTPGFIGYRPALDTRFARYTEDDFSLHEDAFTDAVWVPVADGLVDLGEWFVVKDLSRNHLAFGWPAGEGRNDVVEMRDETLQPRHATQWRFWLTQDEATAIQLAERNLRPTVWIAE